MKLVTITNWAYGITVALTLASGATMLLAADAHETERAAVRQRYELNLATKRVSADVIGLTNHVREYVITGDETYRLLYERDLSDLGSVSKQLAGVRDAGASAAELADLKKALQWANTLRDQHKGALRAYLAGEKSTALQILFGPEFEREITRMSDRFADFEGRLDQRTEGELAEATRWARLWSAAAEIMLSITALLFLCVLVFIVRRRILQPVIKLSDVVNRLAEQDFEAEPASVHQIDEIGDIASALRVFRENGIQRQRLEAERAEEQAKRELLARMTQRLHGCENEKELSRLVECFVPQIVSGYAGRLLVLDEEHDLVKQVCAWDAPQFSGTSFAPSDCWGLRRGLPHHNTISKVDIPCRHIGEAEVETICLPLSAQRETLGLLYFEREAGSDADMPHPVFLNMLAENIGLALANLHLREALRAMAMIDPLTGLSNRRELKPVLEHQVTRVLRSGKPVSALMVDIDHFKRINDTFGHEAGDLVIEQTAAVLKNASRKNDFVFRYGGEEFLLLLPGLPAGEAVKRGETIRQRLAELDLTHAGKSLGTVTCSIGAATTPHSVSLAGLVDAADKALYQAKQGGRNRVCGSPANSEKPADNDGNTGGSDRAAG